MSHSSQDDDDAGQWFRVSCEANLDNGSSEFTITDVNTHNPYQRKKEHQLSEHLVPIISKSQLDDVAEELLQEFYPEGLKQPAPIPIRVIADIMGLAIREIRLTKFMNELVHLHHTWHIEIKSIMDMN